MRSSITNITNKSIKFELFKKDKGKAASKTLELDSDLSEDKEDDDHLCLERTNTFAYESQHLIIANDFDSHTNIEYVASDKSSVSASAKVVSFLYGSVSNYLLDNSNKDVILKINPENVKAEINTPTKSTGTADDTVKKEQQDTMEKLYKYYHFSYSLYRTKINNRIVKRLI